MGLPKVFFALTFGRVVSHSEKKTKTDKRGEEKGVKENKNKRPGKGERSNRSNYQRCRITPRVPPTWNFQKGSQWNRKDHGGSETGNSSVPQRLHETNTPRENPTQGGGLKKRRVEKNSKRRAM